MATSHKISAEIKAHQKEVARLERKLQKFQGKLRKLPAKFGFGSMADFIAALQEAGEGNATPVAAGKKSRKRAKITPEVKEKVKAMVKADKTGAEIAKELGISLPSVQNVKKELGLVKARK